MFAKTFVVLALVAAASAFDLKRVLQTSTSISAACTVDANCTSIAATGYCCASVTKGGAAQVNTCVPAALSGQSVTVSGSAYALTCLTAATATAAAPTTCTANSTCPSTGCCQSRTVTLYSTTGTAVNICSAATTPVSYTLTYNVGTGATAFSTALTTAASCIQPAPAPPASPSTPPAATTTATNGTAANGTTGNMTTGNATTNATTATNGTTTTTTTTTGAKALVVASATAVFAALTLF